MWGFVASFPRGVGSVPSWPPGQGHEVQIPLSRKGQRALAWPQRGARAHRAPPSRSRQLEQSTVPVADLYHSNIHIFNK